MSDTPAPEVTPVEPSEQTVPYHRFKEANDRAKAASTQLTELQARLDEIENQGKSELERERSKRTEYEKQAGELSARIQNMERSGWIRTAALAAGFEDPDDAVAFISASSVESDADAEKAVKALAKRKPKLLRDEKPAPPQIGQVLQNGQVPQPGQTVEIDPASLELLKQVQAAQASGWTSSTIE